MGKEDRQGSREGWWKHALPYGEALVLVFLTVILQMQGGRLFEQRAYCSPLLIATCYATWRGGKGPGLVSIFAGGVAALYFLAPPRYSFRVDEAADIVSIALYLLVGVAIILFGDAHRSERQKVVQREAELKIAYAKLEESNAALDALITRRTAELTEIKNFVAEEL